MLPQQPKRTTSKTLHKVAWVAWGGMGGMNHNMSMDLGPADADYDLRFIDGMTVHHQGAVKHGEKRCSTNPNARK